MDHILDRVRKLLRLSQSPNANEAAAAAAKAQELIDRHKLSSTMLALDDSTPTGLDDGPITDFADSPLDTPKQLDRWRAALATTIGNANACKMYCRGPRLFIIGRPSDADTVRYLYSWLSREVERLTTESGAGKGRTWRNNFRLGVCDTIANKFYQQRQQFEQAVRQEATVSGGQALMRVNQGLQRMTERKLEVAKWVKDNVTLRSRGGGSSSTYDHGARSAGRKAGESIAIGRAKRGLASASPRLN